MITTITLLTLLTMLTLRASTTAVAIYVVRS
jgi:hypothetical protein